MLLAGCAKIFGVDDSGNLSDGGIGQPCDPSTTNGTPCGEGLTCIGGTGAGVPYTCAKSCTSDMDCPAMQGCLAVNPGVIGGSGGGNFTYACQPNGSCSAGACGWSGTTCSSGTCRDTCDLSGGMGQGQGTCPSDESCTSMCPNCPTGVCQPTGSSSGGEGGAEAGATLAPLPDALTETACAAGSDGKIYVFGGMNAFHAPTKTTYVYDPAANKWTSGMAMSTARYGAGVGLGQSPGVFFVVGGFDLAGGAVGANEMYDAFSGSGGLWTQEPPMPSPLGGSAVYGIGMFFVAGGATTANGMPVTTVEQFQNNDMWNNQVPPTLPAAVKWAGASQSTGGGMLVIGGFDDNGHATPAVQRLDNTAWTMVAPMPTPRGKIGTASGPNMLAFAVGGADDVRVLRISEAYASNTNQWMTLAPMPTAREGLCLAWVQGMGSGRLYAIGGDDGASPSVNALTTVEAYDIGSNTWIR